LPYDRSTVDGRSAGLDNAAYPVELNRTAHVVGTFIDPAEPCWRIIRAAKLGYLPALSALLNGIEASFRVTLHLLNKEDDRDIRDVSPYRVLSDKPILQGHEAGMPVSGFHTGEPHPRQAIVRLCWFMRSSTAGST
jgi:hypothetical protein